MLTGQNEKKELLLYEKGIPCRSNKFIEDMFYKI